METKSKIISLGILSMMVAFTLFTRCSKETPSRIGFDVVIEEGSHGLTIAPVQAQVVSLNLDGWITVDMGEVKVELLDPEGFLAYERYFPAPGTYRVTETFKALTGNWSLRYNSLRATGNLTMHLVVRE
jgi:hypothetical protein